MTTTTNIKLTAGNITRILNQAGYRQGAWNRNTDRVTAGGFFTDYNKWMDDEYVTVNVEYTGRYDLTADQMASRNQLIGQMAITLITAGLKVELKSGYENRIYLVVTK